MTTFEQKVISYERECEEANIILRGSDEHLDMLLEVKLLMEPLSTKLDNLLISLTPDINNFSIEELQKALPSLLDLYGTTIKTVSALKRSPISRDLKQCCSTFYQSVDNLREFIYDIETFRIRDDEDLDRILQDINLV